MSKFICIIGDEDEYNFLMAIDAIESLIPAFSGTYWILMTKSGQKHELTKEDGDKMFRHLSLTL